MPSEKIRSRDEFVFGYWFVAITTRENATRMTPSGSNEYINVRVWFLCGTKRPVDKAMFGNTIIPTDCIRVMHMLPGRNNVRKYATVVERVLRPNCPTVDASKRVVDAMVDALRTKRRGCFVIHGPTGTGKSTTMRLLAHRLNATLCPYYDPTQPGQYLINIRQCVEMDQPVVVGLEDVDDVLAKLGMIDTTRHIVEVEDKHSWENLLTMAANLPNVIMVMTTTRSMEDVHRLYESFMQWMITQVFDLSPSAVDAAVDDDTKTK